MGFLKHAAAVLVLGLTAPLWAQETARHAILVDRSGSMRPYYGAGLVQQIGEELVAEAQGEGRAELFAFHSTVTPLRQIGDSDALPFGDSTLLDRALDGAIGRKPAIVWMVTDNVQHQPGEAEAGNTEVFYRRLRSSAVKRVTVLPVLQPAGRAGIVVYAILLDPSRQEEFDNHVESVRKRLGAVDVKAAPLRMKPLDRNTVNIAIVRRGIDEQVKVEVGDRLQESLDIRFESRFDHLDLVDVAIEEVQAQPAFQDGTLLTIDKKVVVITPKRIDRLSAGGQTEQVYRVDLDLGEVNLKRGLAALWEAAWKRSGETAEVQLEFVIRVPQKNFRMRQKFAKAFSASTPAEAASTGRVFAIDRLPKLMAEVETEVKAQSPLRFRIQYPMYPALVWVGLFALILGVLFFGVRFLIGLGGGRWRVVATQPGVTLTSVLDRKGHLSVQDETAGKVVKGEFVPEPGVVLVGASDNNRVALADDGVTTCRLRTERLGAFTLEFRKEGPESSGSANGVSSDHGYAPEER